jgi:CTP:molybdopterin cytidylyltransferase MocA
MFFIVAQASRAVLPGTLVPMPVAAIVLAAGASRRLGQPKQLLMLGSETLLERVLRLAGEAGATPVIVVLGAHSEQIRAGVPFVHAVPVLNSAWEQGMASSIHTALDALDTCAPQDSGVLILSCDQPRLTANHLRAMLESFAAQPAPTIVASAYAGVLGIPAVFPRKAFADLRALRGDRGARALLTQPPFPLISLPFPGGEIDIDVPTDLVQLEP